jgi:hypothetical protein
VFYVIYAVQCFKIKLQIPQQAHTGLVEKGEKKKFVFLCHHKGTSKRKDLSDEGKIIFNKPDAEMCILDFSIDAGFRCFLKSYSQFINSAIRQLFNSAIRFEGCAAFKLKVLLRSARNESEKWGAV